MYCTRKKGSHLTFNDRGRIEVMYKLGHTQLEIAREIGCSQSTISREIKKGIDTYLNGDTWRMVSYYNSDKGQRFADFQKTSHSSGLKIGNNFSYLRDIESAILDNCSPQAAVSMFSSKYGFTFSRTTIYRYIRMGLFPSLTYKHLPQGSKTVHRGKMVKRNISHPEHTSIERRSADVLTRVELGHWEIDSVIGKASGSGESCLVLSERKTRQEILLKVREKSSDATISALRFLRRALGPDYHLLFKTLTCDNGSEFASEKGIADSLHTEVFYCHPSCPFERGTNENINKLVRRKLPKGQSMKQITRADARKVQHWVNTYPRPMFDGKCGNDMFFLELDKLPLVNPERVKFFFSA